MHGTLHTLVIIVWAIVGLVIASIAAAYKGRMGFVWTLIAMWVGVPLALASLRKVDDVWGTLRMNKIRAEYQALCGAADRVVVRSTVTGIEEVGVWPASGPRDNWDNDLFFQTRKSADEWIRGYAGGRYGGFKRAVLSPLEAHTAASPRYQVVFGELRTEPIMGSSLIRGLHIKIIDRQTNDVLAERRDYIAQHNFGFPRGCEAKYRGPSDQWFNDNLAFIHKVLNPPPGVRVIHREIPRMWDQVLGGVAPRETRAHVLRELPPTHVDRFRRTNYLPENVRYEPIYRTTPSDVRMSDYRIVFMYEDRDVSVAQGLGTNATLLAMTRDTDDYLALFWLGDVHFMLLRRFNAQANLIDHEKVALPESIGPVTFLNSPDKTLFIEPSQYRIRVSLNPREGKFEKDVELAFPRHPRRSR